MKRTTTGGPSGSPNTRTAETQDRLLDAYAAALGRLHDHYAQRLLKHCQSMSGLQIDRVLDSIRFNTVAGSGKDPQ